MNAVRLIERKRDGQAHSPEEIAALVSAFVQGEMPDYQMAAWLMAATIRGLDFTETVGLTDAMVRSGAKVEISSDRPIVDKHSTGGVGDKVTLVAGPLLASLGLAVPKLSGRGLGHTGGTLDKLESIPGLRTALSLDEFRDCVLRTGIAVAAQSAEIVPADQKMYALRDVTGTVPSIPLIAASIMSKKLAVSSELVVLDVKVGDGAFFPDLSGAKAFAALAIRIGAAFGRRVTAVLSSMDTPLGRAVGNAIEVREAITCLRGEGPEDLREVTLAVCGAALSGALGLAAEEARARASAALEGGQGLAAFAAWITAQGGDGRITSHPELLPLAGEVEVVRAERSGFLGPLAARAVGDAARSAGAGRLVKTDAVDPGAGIEILRTTGDAVRAGDEILRIHAREGARLSAAAECLRGAFEVVSLPPERGPRVFGQMELGQEEF